jgi:hypothetical protein
VTGRGALAAAGAATVVASIAPQIATITLRMALIVAVTQEFSGRLSIVAES